MSKDLFEKPQIVKEAASSQKGLNWALEMLIFVAVFFVCQIAMGFVVTPVEIAMLFSNADYVNAIASNDVGAIVEASMEASMKLASSDLYMIIMLLAEIMMILVVCLFCKLLQKRKLVTLGFGKKGAVKEYLIGMLAGFGFFSLAVLLGVLSGGLKIEGISPSFSIGMFLLYLLGFMIQGMAEEVLCRGYFMVSYARKYPVYAAVLMNALLFAALHLPNSGLSVLAFVNLALFGIFASVYFIRRGNIWGIGAFHSIWNLVQGNFYGIKVSGNDFGDSFLNTTVCEGKDLFSGGAFGLEGSIWVTVILCAGTVLLYLWKKKPDAQEA